VAFAFEEGEAMTGAVDFESDDCAFFLAAHHALSVIVGHSDAAPVVSAPKVSRTADFVNGRFG
jgi:phosphate transport system ATP-binding protein